MKRDFLYKDEKGEVRGPVAAVELEEMLRSGLLHFNTKIKKVDAVDWYDLRKLVVFLEAQRPKKKKRSSVTFDDLWGMFFKWFMIIVGAPAAVLWIGGMFFIDWGSDEKPKTVKISKETKVRSAIRVWMRYGLKDADGELESLDYVIPSADSGGYLAVATILAKNSFGVKLRKHMGFEISKDFVVIKAYEK